jgi:NAD-dependent DNA ligase
MAQREGSFYLSLFIAAFILFAATVAVVFVLQSKVDEVNQEKVRLSAQISEADGRLRKAVAEINAIRTLVGGADAADAWPGVAFYEDELRKAEEEFTRVAQEFDANLSVGTYRALHEPYSDFLKVLDALHTSAEAARSEAQTAREHCATVTTAKDETIQSLDEEKSQLREQIATLQADLEDSDTSHSQRVDELSAEVERLEEENADLAITYRRQNLEADAREARLRTRLELETAEKTKQRSLEDIEPDGRIVEVESRTKTAWIDLARGDSLSPGMIFQVFQNVGGRRSWKGSVEVARVGDQGVSQVRVVEETSELNPISANDFITSPFYDRNDRPSFVFAGDTSRLPMTLIERKIEAVGATLQRQVDVTTDFIVVLENYERTTEYLAAKELGVTVIREADLRKYLGM